MSNMNKGLCEKIVDYEFYSKLREERIFSGIFFGWSIIIRSFVTSQLLLLTFSSILQVGGEVCQGLLTGLVSIEDSKLEITNCFPTARAEPILDDENAVQANQAYEELKQAEMLDMLKKFR